MLSHYKVRRVVQFCMTVIFLEYFYAFNNLSMLTRSSKCSDKSGSEIKVDTLPLK